jgi:hypothetical protein
VNDDGFSLFQTKRVVNALQRGQPGNRDRAGMAQIEPLGDRRGFVGGYHDILCVESALRVRPVVRIDFIADLQPPHP